MDKLKVINFYGGPGTGKSTTAAGLFHLMKSRGHNVELVREFAKDLVWHERHKEMHDQLYLFAKQNHKLHMLQGKVDFVITDAPLLNSLVYGKDQPAIFRHLVESVYSEYDNTNINLLRIKKYNPSGRTQTEEEAKALGELMYETVAGMGKYWSLEADEDAPDCIYKTIIEDLL